MLQKTFRNKKSNIKKIFIFMFLVCFCMIIYFLNDLDKVQLTNISGNSYEKAQVVEVMEDNLEDDGSRVGYQKVRIKILSGKYKGEELDATSFSGYLYGADCTENMRVIVKISETNNSKVISVYSFYREPIIFAFVGLFLLMLYLIGGKKGVKSAIGLAFTFICIMFMFLPMLYRGYSPFLSAVIIIIFITVISLYLIDGLTRKSISAMLGTIIGVIIAGIFAAIFGYFAQISGYNVSEVEELVFVSNNTKLQVGGILFAGILIASLGAIMDVSMSIASTVNEIYEHNPQLTKGQLFKSGVNVGKDMMGTMSNTLILAFTGGSLNTLILNYAYSLKYSQIINMYEIGIEIMQGVSGSIAIILTVPLVSFIAATFLTIKNNKFFIL